MNLSFQSFDEENIGEFKLEPLPYSAKLATTMFWPLVIATVAI